MVMPVQGLSMAITTPITTPRPQSRICRTSTTGRISGGITPPSSSVTPIHRACHRRLCVSTWCTGGGYTHLLACARIAAGFGRFGTPTGERTYLGHDILQASNRPQHWFMTRSAPSRLRRKGFVAERHRWVLHLNVKHRDRRRVYRPFGWLVQQAAEIREATPPLPHQPTSGPLLHEGCGPEPLGTVSERSPGHRATVVS